MAQASACALKRTAIRMSGLFRPKNFRKYQKPQFVHLNFKALFEAQADACAMNLLLFHNENPQLISVEHKRAAISMIVSDHDALSSCSFSFGKHLPIKQKPLKNKYTLSVCESLAHL